MPYQAYPNNVRDFFETGSVSEHSVSLQGTGDNATFSSVLSRADTRGTIPNSKFVRNSISAGGSGTYNKFTIAGSVSYANSEQLGPQLGANNAVGNATAFARTLFLPRNLDLQGLPYIDPVTRQQRFGWLTNQADNPRWSVENNTYRSRVDRTTASASVSYAIKEWLTFSYTGGINTYVDNRTTTVRPGSNAAGGDGSVLEDNLQNTELEQTALLTFNRNLTEDISLRASLGHNTNQRTFNALSYAGKNIIVFGIDNIDNTTDRGTNGYAYSRRRLMGVLGDATIGYKDWAFLTATARNDWSSTLNRDGKQGQSGRAFFYPSVSGSVVVNEAFGLDLPWLSLAKVRAAYGRVGRDADPYLAGPTRYGINPSYGNVSQQLGVQFPFNGQPGLALGGGIGNPALTPEFKRELEIGGDLSLWKNRISLGGSYYNNSTINQIAPISLTAATGFGAYFTNFGELRNEGVELAFTAIPVQTTNGFQWSSTVNFTRNRNTVVSLTEGADTLTIGTAFSGGIQAVLIKGEQYGAFYGTTAARVDNKKDGELLINPNTGRMVQRREAQILGNPNPDFLLGFINQFTFKGFTLNTLIDYRQGGQLYSTTLRELLGRGVTKDTEDRERFVIIKGVLAAPNDLSKPLRDANNSTIPNNVGISLNDFYFGPGSAAINSFDDVSIYDATTVRLREVTLGYDLPRTLLSKTPFSQFNISLSGRNLYWYSPNIPKYTNFDPETSTFGASNQQGFEYTNAPTTRRYGVNLRVTF